MLKTSCVRYYLHNSSEHPIMISPCSHVSVIKWKSLLFMIDKCNDGAAKWKLFPCYWPFVRGIHRTPVDSPYRGQWRGTSMFFLTNGWAINQDPSDFKRHRTHYDVTVMLLLMQILLDLTPSISVDKYATSNGKGGCVSTSIASCSVWAANWSHWL